jgi:hypothetical protein
MAGIARAAPAEGRNPPTAAVRFQSIAMPCPIPVIGRWRPERPGGENPNKDAVSGRRNGYAPALERRERRQRRQARRTSGNGGGSDPGGGGFRSGPLANPSSRTRLGNRRAIRRRAVVPNGGKGHGLQTGRAKRPSHCRPLVRFAPKVDSCARPPAAWAINDLKGFCFDLWQPTG